MINLLALSGKRGSGKDTVARIIQQLQPERDWQVVSYGDAIKSVCAALSGETTAPYYTQPGKAELLPVYGLTRGEMLQQVGQALRSWRPEIWVEALFANLPPDKPVIIPDLRFPNEAEPVLARGGQVWRVEGDPQQQRGDGTRDDNHPSETAMDNYNRYSAVLHNTGSMMELRRKVQAQLESA